MVENNKEHIPKKESSLPKQSEINVIEWQKQGQIQKTREQLKEELKSLNEEQLVDRMVNLLKRKYPDKAEVFSKKSIDVWEVPKMFDTVWTRLYLLKSNENGKLLSYLDNWWDTLLDMTTFLEKYGFRNKLIAHTWKWSRVIEKDGFLYYKNEEWILHKEWSDRFNWHLVVFYIDRIIRKKYNLKSNWHQ